MFKIGEFSKLTQVTVRMLRYYDEMGLLKPAKIDPWTGYRLYSTEQIPVLNKIIYLRDSGFQVAEIAAALENNDKAFLQELFNKKQAEIEENIKIEQEKLSKIDLASMLCSRTKMICITRFPSNQFPVILYYHCGKSFLIIMPKANSGKNYLLLQGNKI